MYFVRTRPRDKELVISGMNDFIHKHENKWCIKKKLVKGEWVEERVKFVPKWLDDTTMRTYNKLTFAPPPAIPDKDSYNLFQGFMAERTYAPMGGVDPFLHHARVTAGNDEKCFKYLVHYFANIIQFLGRRSNVAILLKGEQGAGKNLLMSFHIQKVLNDDLGFETAKPEDHLLGQFANGRVNKLLIVVNEANGKACFPQANLLKDMITSDTMKFEQKHHDPIVLPNYARLMFTSNHDNPSKIEAGDCRFVVFMVGSNYVGNHKCFQDLLKYVSETANARAVYEYLKTVDLSDVDLARDMPMTEAYDDMKRLALSFEYGFLENITFKYRNTAIFTSSGLFAELQEWKTKNNVKREVKCADFCKKITKISKNVACTAIRQVRTKKGNGFEVDFITLKDYMIDNGFMRSDDELGMVNEILDFIDERDVKRESRK
jgi:hypothetical protein